uniref:EF-hand domain-containing protein n=1 Tax=Alexandrium catenella TaxID=2925 RepID=A0A7S1WP63_ALECA|mmetsp:Transcript_77724/g.206400  ORF Transcript_77724/g.206400 Transcript_77724/m.206400 type:complete len:112 (+) Transcript_77724:60-395(+)
MRLPASVLALLCILPLALSGKSEKDDKHYEQIHSDLDANKDGFVTLDEFKIANHSVEEDKESLRKIIANLDKDGDGKLNMQEVRGLEDEFDREFEERRVKIARARGYPTEL